MRTGTAPDAPAPRMERRLGVPRWRAAIRRLGARPWLAAVQLLAVVRPLPRPRRRPTPVRPSRPDQLRALVAVLDEAVAAQTPADEAVAACGEPGPVSRGTARDCGQQSITLHRLRARLQDLRTTDPDLVAAQARAGRLLAYDLWMLRASMNLAFTTRPVDRTEAARLRLNGLGRPADDLRRLRDSLRAELRNP
ncbi:hypothetical protein OOK27_32985 [Streptomyces canus]|uniref:hypothetical protein n=1 Tax=Streptomyces canus TaxID=58343 RepID=UPI0022531E55|nr:hypothetical protein [Streptomyces canus]MCX5258895.1 hypothetical protein [Streptomyces canus]